MTEQSAGQVVELDAPPKASAFAAPGVRAGLVAGLALVLVPAAIVFGLAFTRLGAHAFLVRLGPTELLTVKSRIVRSFMSPWPASVETTFQPGSAFERTLTATRIDFFGLVCLLIVLTGVGWLVRRWCGPSLRQRALALAVSTVVVALSLAALVLLGDHVMRFQPALVEADSRLDAGLVVRGVLLAAVASFFAFGLPSVIGRLGGAASLAAALVATVTVAAALLFAVLLPLGRMPGEATASRAELAGSAGAYATGVGAAAVPLLVGARASLDVGDTGHAPFAVGGARAHPALVWPRLARTLERESPGRIYAYGATGWLTPLLVACALVFVGAWTFAGALLARRGTRLRERLEGPLVFALVGASLVTIIAVVGTTQIEVSPSDSGAGQLWGKRASDLLPTLLVLLALPLLGAFGALAADAVATRRREQPSALTETSAPEPAAERGSGRFCTRCGAAASEGGAFCGECGHALPQEVGAP